MNNDSVTKLTRTC